MLTLIFATNGKQKLNEMLCFKNLWFCGHPSYYFFILILYLQYYHYAILFLYIVSCDSIYVFYFFIVHKIYKYLCTVLKFNEKLSFMF